MRTRNQKPRDMPLSHCGVGTKFWDGNRPEKHSDAAALNQSVKTGVE